MALPSSGQITLNQVNVELGNSGTAQIDMNSAAVRGLFGVASGQIRMSDGYGKANEFVLTNEGTINGQSNRKQITVSSFISSGETIKVPSGFWVWSDSTSVPAMIIDIPCTVINEGKIIGKGGTNNGSSGSPAIKINSGVTGVTITNSSGAYIAGIRPGEQTANYIDSVLARLTVFGAIYLTLICLLPLALINFAGISPTISVGGTSVLIIVVVLMDFMAQVQSHMMSSQYASLMKKANLKNYKR